MRTRVPRSVCAGSDRPMHPAWSGCANGQSHLVLEGSSKLGLAPLALFASQAISVRCEAMRPSHPPTKQMGIEPAGGWRSGALVGLTRLR